jgi:hypothetical protein
MALYDICQTGGIFVTAISPSLMERGKIYVQLFDARVEDSWKDS